MNKGEKHMKDKVKLWAVTGAGVVNALVVNVFGVFTPLLYVVLGLMLFDLGSRMYAAAMREDEKVESKKVFKGFGSKFGMIMLIFLSVLIDYGLGIVIELVLGLAGIESPISIIAVMPFTLAWIFIREATSICENLVHAGVNVPRFIISALTVTNVAVDKVDDMMGGKSNGNS